MYLIFVESALEFCSSFPCTSDGYVKSKVSGLHTIVTRRKLLINEHDIYIHWIGGCVGELLKSANDIIQKQSNYPHPQNDLGGIK